MKARVAIALLLIAPLGSLAANGAGAASRRYAVDVRRAKADDENQLVTLRDTQAHRVLWTRKLFQPQVTWSKDHRAVVIEGSQGTFVWREGKPMSNIGFPVGRNSDGQGYTFDYSMGCVWSPDKTRLLIRYGASGSSMVGDTGIGSLFCLKFGPRNARHWTFIAGSVTRMKWRDNRTVFYEALHYNQRMEATAKSHTWRAR